MNCDTAYQGRKDPEARLPPEMKRGAGDEAGLVFSIRIV